VQIAVRPVQKESAMSFSRFVLCLSLGAVIGCGDSSESSKTVAVRREELPAVVVNTGNVGSITTKSTNRRPDEVWVDQDGRKYIGRVPYDVFFDHPLEVASEGQLADSPSISNVSDAAADIPVADRKPSDAVAGPATEVNTGTGWGVQFPVDVLESEVKSARNFLKEKLQSVANYNSAVTMIPVRAAMIALLAGIAAEHRGDISWKEDAFYVRDLARSINGSVLKRGPKDQRRLLAIFENLADTLNRSRPAGLEAPSAEIALSDAAGMGMIMLRIQESEQRLRTEVTEGVLKSQSQMVRHEASLMIGLMHAISQESYGYSDDPEFLAYAQRVIDAGGELRDAAESGQFAGFELGLTKAAGACQACHRDYKSN